MFYLPKYTYYPKFFINNHQTFFVTNRSQRGSIERMTEQKKGPRQGHDIALPWNESAVFLHSHTN